MCIDIGREFGKVCVCIIVEHDLALHIEDDNAFGHGIKHGIQGSSSFCCKGGGIAHGV